MQIDFQNRIRYQGDISILLNKICIDYNFGNLKSFRVVYNGYEDFNIVIKTNSGIYFVKIFAAFRDLEECQRYISIIRAVIKAGISHPSLFKSRQGYLYETDVDGTKTRLCVLEFIDGETFYQNNIIPTKSEIKYIIDQTVVINKLELKPKLLYDSWAIINLLKEFENKKTYLEKSDYELLIPVVKDFEKIKINELPHCFVHGDIIKTNIIKDRNNKLYIIDFSVANHYPRIQELAVLFCSLFFNETNNQKNIDSYQYAINEYTKSIKLTKFEIETLPLYVRAAHAMHVLAANHEKIVNKNRTEENNYWYRLGRLGLKMESLYL